MNKNLLKIAFVLGSLSGVVGWANTAGAADWSIPHSWRWPLYVRAGTDQNVQTGEPRIAVWTSTSELQIFGPDINDTYLHPGIDIRGDHGDPVIVPASGTIERVYSYTDMCLASGNYCRIWFKTDDDHFLYYVSHIDLAPTPAAGRRQVSTEIRTQIQNAVNGTGDRSVTAGQKLATLTMFSADPNGWHHLHFGIVDKKNNYNLQDTLAFLEQRPIGETGARLDAIDDEPPVISEVQLVKDQTSISAVRQGTCGSEVFAKVDIASQITDTFHTRGTFASFPGKGTQPATTGIRTARYLVRSQATGNVVQQGTWYDLVQTPMACPSATTVGGACLLPGVTATDQVFLDQMANGSGAPAAGLTIMNKLFDMTRSVTNYTTNEVYWHILTNAGAVEGSWDATQQPIGKYQVSVEATDFEGNSAAKSLFVTVHDPAVALNPSGHAFGDAYLSDNSEDSGAVPSTLGGKPFWVSPDIILVAQGTPVTVDTPSAQSLVTADVPVDVYLRLHNDGCAPISGVKAQIFWANPAAISNDWRSIAPVGAALGQFAGDLASPNGVTVPAGGKALLGPFTLTPTSQEAQSGGHRCLLAALNATDDPVAASNELDAPNFNNVSQRNLQVGSCEYQLPNPNNSNSSLGLTIDTTAEVEDADTVVRVIFSFDAAWLSAWANVPGTVVTQDGSNLVVELHARHVVLPNVTLPPGAARTLQFTLDLPRGTSSRTVNVTPVLDGKQVQGASCSDVGGPIVK